MAFIEDSLVLGALGFAEKSVSSVDNSGESYISDLGKLTVRSISFDKSI